METLRETLINSPCGRIAIADMPHSELISVSYVGAEKLEGPNTRIFIRIKASRMALV